MITPELRNPPDPPKTKVLDLPRLDGGLNLWELDYRISADQSPRMCNLYWKDGALGARRGQADLYEVSLGTVHASHSREFWGCGIFHAGTSLYKMDMATGTATAIKEGLTPQGGSFFIYGDYLYYINGAEYIRIDAEFTVTDVEGYTPVIIMNMSPNGTGGDEYQPENRLSAYKTVWFNADGTTKKYQLPIKELDADKTVKCVVDGKELATTAYTVDYPAGTVTFTTAPPKQSPMVNNTVRITFAKTDQDTLDSVRKCRYATTFGGENAVAVVLAGSPGQLNAYYWSGANFTVDPAYFPYDQYQLAGNSDEAITGFGKQQRMLVVFKERSIGKASFNIATITDRDFLELPYISINTNIGCNLPKTIKLVVNNLVFANSYGGVYMLLDSTVANENNVERLSLNINGTDQRPGLLADVQRVPANLVSSVDDDQRYWIVANGHAYLWDYVLSPYYRNKSEGKLAWFYFDNIRAVTWIKTLDDIYYGTTDGRWVRFIDRYNDFGEPIHQVYEFAVQNFETFETLKDVLKVIFVVRSDTNTTMEIEYKTDYERRMDLTPIIAYNWSLVPRDLRYRYLGVTKYAKVEVRKPGCRHIRHFSMALTNERVDSGMSLVSAQIIYRMSGVDR